METVRKLIKAFNKASGSRLQLRKAPGNYRKSHRHICGRLNTGQRLSIVGDEKFLTSRISEMI